LFRQHLALVGQALISVPNRFPMHLLASYPYVQLYLHQGAARALEARWTGTATSAQLRQATLACVELARAYGVTGWVADDRALGPVRPEDLSWISTYVFPLLIRGGVHRFARLAPEGPRTQQVVGLAQDLAVQQLPFALRSFTDVWQARAWACEEPHPSAPSSS
jgi:hypothetical protein